MPLHRLLIVRLNCRPDTMLHIVLYNPEIPQNSGNIGRLCAISNLRLHLIRPLGFRITDKYLKRSGMDYWESLDKHIHNDWDQFKKSSFAPQRLWLFTTKVKKCYWDVSFEDGDGLLFGSEGGGVPQWLHDQMDYQRVTIPHANNQMRSFNLATSVGIGAFEALRQIDKSA